LEERRAGVETCAGQIEHTPARSRGGISIDDDVQPGEREDSGLGARNSGLGIRSLRPPQRGGPGEGAPRSVP
jgi:hypothetical protein